MSLLSRECTVDSEHSLKLLQTYRDFSNKYCNQWRWSLFGTNIATSLVKYSKHIELFKSCTVSSYTFIVDSIVLLNMHLGVLCSCCIPWQWWTFCDSHWPISKIALEYASKLLKCSKDCLVRSLSSRTIRAGNEYIQQELTYNKVMLQSLADINQFIAAMVMPCFVLM